MVCPRAQPPFSGFKFYVFNPSFYAAFLVGFARWRERETERARASARAVYKTIS